jgi:hypothetical protein
LVQEEEEEEQVQEEEELHKREEQDVAARARREMEADWAATEEENELWGERAVVDKAGEARDAAMEPDVADEGADEDEASDVQGRRRAAGGQRTCESKQTPTQKVAIARAVTTKWGTRKRMRQGCERRREKQTMCARRTSIDLKVNGTSE